MKDKVMKCGKLVFSDWFVHVDYDSDPTLQKSLSIHSFHTISFLFFNKLWKIEMKAYYIFFIRE